MSTTAVASGVKSGGSSPWGTIQIVEEIGPGIQRVHTAGHGGLKLDRKRNAAVPEYMRRTGGWYEEDCEYAIPIVVFPESFSPQVLPGAESTLKNYFPDEYERFRGTVILPGESYARDEKAFHEKHKNDWVVVSAWSDGEEWVPYGMVGVCASPGRSYEPGRLTKWFLVPVAEYQARGKFGFVIDPARHIEIKPRE